MFLDRFYSVHTYMMTPNVAIPNPESMLLLFDYKWFVNNEKEIKDWCARTLSKFEQTGMVLHFANEKEKMLFLLKWS